MIKSTPQYRLVAPEKIVYESENSNSPLLLRPVDEGDIEYDDQTLKSEADISINPQMPDPMGDSSSIVPKNSDDDSDYYDDDDVLREINELKNRIGNLESLAKSREIREKIMFASFGIVVLANFLKYFSLKTVVEKVHRLCGSVLRKD